MNVAIIFICAINGLWGQYWNMQWLDYHFSMIYASQVTLDSKVHDICLNLNFKIMHSMVFFMLGNFVQAFGLLAKKLIQLKFSREQEMKWSFWD